MIGRRSLLPLVTAAAALALAACGNSSPRAQTPTATAPGPAPRPALGDPCGRTRTPRARYDHVVWIVMENHAYGEVVGSPSAPTVNRLAGQCGLATHFTAETHPSLPNYVAMTSGSPQGVSDDDAPSAHPLRAASLFSQLGPRGWRALEESMPSPCDLASSGEYAVKHNPAAYFMRIRGACRRNDLPLRARPDLSARFTFVTPNLCHDMHDCDVRAGDRWLSGFLPKVFASRQYRAGRTAVFLTWDEDDSGSGNRIATLVVAPSVVPGTRSGIALTHYSLLRTTEELLGLRPLLGRAAQATSMRRAFHL